MVKVYLTLRQQGLLRDILLRSAPQLVGRIDELLSKEVAHAKRLEVVDAVFDELTSAGIDARDGINSFGIELDALISALRPSDED